MCVPNSSPSWQGYSQPLFQYTANNSFSEMFNFADNEIQRYDFDRDGVLNIRELSNSYGGDIYTASQYMDVLDRNGDSNIDGVEASALLILSDKAFGEDPDGVIQADEAQVTDQIIQQDPEFAGQLLDQLIGEPQADRNGKSASLQERYTNFTYENDLMKQIRELHLEPESVEAKSLQDFITGLKKDTGDQASPMT